MNNNYTTHIASVKDGSIVLFPNSAYYYMKVCNRIGIGGVVRLYNGLYIPVRDLEHYVLGLGVQIVADSLDELYREDNE